jgi:hypothetical protein
MIVVSSLRMLGARPRAVPAVKEMSEHLFVACMEAEGREMMLDVGGGKLNATLMTFKAHPRGFHA